MDDVPPSVASFLLSTSQTLRGIERRKFIGKTAVEIFGAIAHRAARVVGWNRTTVAKAIAEHQRGEFIEGRKGTTGRKPAEHHLPHLLDDLRELCEGHSQTDPTFHSEKLYTRLSGAGVGRLLVELKGYAPATVPNEDTLLQKMHALGFFPQRVRKTKPKKNSRKPTRSSSR